MRKPILAILAVCVSGFAVTAQAAGEGDGTPVPPTTPVTPAVACDRTCQIKDEYGKLRRETTRNPVTACIVAHESHGQLHAGNSSGAGGRYQIMPSTWSANLPGRHFVRVAQSIEHHFRRYGQDEGPQWSGRLLQDKVADNIARSSGLAPWTQYDGC